MRKFGVALLLVCIVAPLSFSLGTVEIEPDVMDVVTDNDDFSTLLTAIDAAGLARVLRGRGPFTVFAPTNDAFSALPDGRLDELLADRAALRNVLLYHVVADELTASRVLRRDSLDTLAGEPAAISTREGNAYIENAQIIDTNIQVGNGVIHVIDGVITPPSLRPPLLSVAENDGRFTTIISAIDALEARPVITAEEGPYTVFIPQDSAFADVTQEEIDAVLAEPVLAALIGLYHVVPGTITAADLGDFDTIETYEGSLLRVGSEDGQATINGVPIVEVDIQGRNGVMHVIDGYLVPRRVRGGM